LDAALEVGYRHIDTAHVYRNEPVVGKVLKRWLDAGKVQRKDLYVVTKLPPSGNRAESVEKYFKRSLDALQCDYIDLYLIHVPFAFNDVEGDLHPLKPDGTIDLDKSTDHISLWKAMEKLVESGRVKSIGLSNFNETQVKRILDNSRIKPVNLQIELHAYLQQNELVDFCRKNDIVVTAYSPIGSPGLGKFFAAHGKNVTLPSLFSNPVVKKIAEKHGKSPAQVLLRHTHQRGIVVIPKSTNKKRLAENLALFDFSLSDDEMAKMNELNKDSRILNFSDVFKGIEEHPEYPTRKN